LCQPYGLHFEAAAAADAEELVEAAEDAAAAADYAPALVAAAVAADATAAEGAPLADFL
jgi:hypothetical protein